MKDLRFFLERLRDFSALAGGEGGGKVVMDSSLNQRMGPRDCNFFLRDESDGERSWHVLVDYQGPGCITRFWTAGDFDGDLEIWLDGELYLRTTLRAFFGGELYPFVKPVVMDCADSSQGRVAYLPILFARGCKIRATSDTRSFYWQVNAVLYGEGTEVATFPVELDEGEQEALEQVRSLWRAPLRFDESGDFQRVRVPARGEAVVLEERGGGRIERIDFELGGAEIPPLALQAFWDGGEEPAVAVPLAHFFCQASKRRDFASLLVGRREGRLTAVFPMPYADGALVKLVNPSTAEVEIGIRISRTEPPCATDLRFHCRYRHEPLAYGTIYQALKVEGRGRFVGMYLVTEQVGEAHHPCFNQEGNEYFYVDGEQDPSWLGTGTEDYFNCAYFYARGEVDTPTHGCLDQRYSEDGLDRLGLVAAYRFHLLDSVPFEKSLLLLQEAGCPKKGALAGVNGKEQLVYRWTCYWYQARGETAGERRDLLV